MGEKPCLVYYFIGNGKEGFIFADDMVAVQEIFEQAGKADTFFFRIFNKILRDRRKLFVGR